MPKAKEPKTEFGRTLREIRRKLGWSQNELSYVLRVSQANISRWESGECLPSHLTQRGVFGMIKDYREENVGAPRHAEEN